MSFYKKYKHPLNVLLLTLAGLLTYSNTFHAGFHFDDFRDIVNNPAIRDIRNLSICFRYAPSRFVAMITFAINYRLHGLNVVGYHVINIAIHIANACLFYILVHQLLVRVKQFSHTHRSIVALSAALFFEVHPIQTQAVTYIVQRMTSLASMFYLLSLVLYIRLRQRKKTSRNFILGILAVISAILGMLTKQIVFTLPVMLLLVEWLLMPHPIYRHRKWRIVWAAGLLMTGFIIPWLHHFDLSLLFRTIPPQQGHLYHITPGSYLLTQANVILTYIRLLLFPIGQLLDYDYPLVHSFLDLHVMISIGIITLLIIIGLSLRKSHPLISFGLFWFFITLSVESSIIPLPNVIFEHRLYLPSVGFIFVLTGLYCWLRNRWNPRLIAMVAIAWLIILAGLTIARNRVWQTEFSLWNNVVRKAPENVRARTIRGKLYAQAGQFEAALFDLNHALERNPAYANARLNRGIVYARQGHMKAALKDFNNVLVQHPGSMEARLNRANVFLALGAFRRAINDYSAVLAESPDIANVYVNRGVAFIQTGNQTAALHDFNTAIRLDPGNQKAWCHRGRLRLQQGQWQAAIDDLTQALSLNPNHVDVLIDRGTAFLYTMQAYKAFQDFTRAIENDSTSGKAYARRAIADQMLAREATLIHDLNAARRLGLNITPAHVYQYASLIRANNKRKDCPDDFSNNLYKIYRPDSPISVCSYGIRYHYDRFHRLQ